MSPSVRPDGRSSKALWKNRSDTGRTAHFREVGAQRGVLTPGVRPVAPTSSGWPIWPVLDRARPCECHATTAQVTAAAVGVCWHHPRTEHLRLALCPQPRRPSAASCTIREDFQMAVGFLFLVLHKESEKKIKFSFWITRNKRSSSRCWSREHKMLCIRPSIQKYTKPKFKWRLVFSSLFCIRKVKLFKSFLFGLPELSRRSSRYWSREHKMLCNTAQYTKVYEIGPSSRMVREAALGRRGWDSATSDVERAIQQLIIGVSDRFGASWPSEPT